MNTDVLIVGSGCSGLYCALKLPRDVRITLITKSDLESNDSFLAQGGMCMLKEQSDFDNKYICIHSMLPLLFTCIHRCSRFFSNIPLDAIYCNGRIITLKFTTDKTPVKLLC